VATTRWLSTDAAGEPERSLTITGFVFSILFFVSGFAALVYQVVWQRTLTFFGGADVYSVTIIVSAFMGGLGFGSLGGGHLADRLDVRRCLLAFAACEIAVAVFAIFSVNLYYDVLYVRLGAWALPRGAMAAIVFAVTLWPTFFMGMSLPLLVRALTQDARRPAHWVPLLYGSNTLGAACGSMFATAILFRSVDFVTSVRLGALLSVGCALGTLLGAPFIRRQQVVVTPERPPANADAIRAPSRFGLWTWIAVYALSGFVALSLEIVWFRVLGVILKSNSFTFGLLLAVYLLGVGLGALVANHRRVRSWSPVPAFLLLQSAIPVVAAVSLALLTISVDRVGWADPLWQYLGEYEPLSPDAAFSSWSTATGGAGPTRRGLFLVLYIVVPLALLGLPTLMMGLSFGHLQRAVQTDLETLGRRVGWLQTANIVGSMLGALLTGLALLDWLGTADTLRLLVCCSGVFLLLYGRTRPFRLVRLTTATAILFVCLVAYSIPTAATLWARLHRALPEDVIQAEDSSGVALLKSGVGNVVTTTVFANGLGQSGLPYGGMHTVLGALPAMVHANPQSIAVIGLGSGDTLFAIGGRAETSTIDSIEIIAPEFETLRRLDQRRFYPGLRILLRDPRVHHWFTDGRAFVRNGGRRYDIIEADALRPMSAYAGNLFSVEYFELLRSRLNPGGLAATWTPTPRVVDSFVKVFPHVLLLEGLALGSTTPVQFDRSAIEARIQQRFTRDYYGRAGIALDQLLAPLLKQAPRYYGPEFDRTSLVNVNRDLFPKDEFAVQWDCSGPAPSQAESRPSVQSKPPGGYEGFLDKVSCDFISGWVWDTSQPGAALTVDLYEGDRRLATSVADRFRPDLWNARKGNGCHAFVEATPPEIKDGRPHSIRAVAKGTSFRLGPLPDTPSSITCAR
jgi:spermidine synthase